MKTAIRIFEILAIVAAAFTGIMVIFVLISLASGNQDVINTFINRNGGASLDQAARNQLISNLITIYSLILVWEIVRIVIASLSLKKIHGPIDSRPICLGILNIFFGSLIGGILLLFLDPEVPELE